MLIPPQLWPDSSGYSVLLATPVTLSPLLSAVVAGSVLTSCEHSRRRKLEQKVSQTGCCCDGPDYVASMSWALSRETGGGYGSLGRKLNIEFNGLLWKLEDNAHSTSDTEALPPASGVEPLEFLQDVRTFERNDYGYSDIVTH